MREDREEKLDCSMLSRVTVFEDVGIKKENLS
jgi:hypothetical protein